MASFSFGSGGRRSMSGSHFVAIETMADGFMVEITVGVCYGDYRNI